MKLLTKQSDYAIRALIEMARNEGGFISTREISERQDVPYQFLRRIIGDLIAEGLVESKEGAGGGVRLAADPSGITVPDVIGIFQGDIELSDCMFRKKICANRGTCVLRREIKRVEDIVRDEFSRISIKTLVERVDGGDSISLPTA